MPDPRKLVEQHLMKIVKEKLRPEQVKRYEDECAQRTARRRRAVVLNLVANLDEELVLSADQREKLIESLTTNYQEGWDQWLVMWIHNIRHLPQIPDKLVAPTLNQKQNVVWQQIPKMDPHMFGGLQFGQAMVMIEDAELRVLENER